jgi:hypothetical protein
MWTLIRKYHKKATIGVLKDPEGLPRMLTLEEPWRKNERKVSCVPEGIYTCNPYNSPKFPRVWELQNVKDRSLILFHSGNTVADTEGCILVGGILTSFGDELAILHSTEALNLLRRLVGVNHSFKLTIKGE